MTITDIPLTQDELDHANKLLAYVFKETEGRSIRGLLIMAHQVFAQMARHTQDKEIALAIADCLRTIAETIEKEAQERFV